jgi:ankyrin repeat protein
MSALSNQNALEKYKRARDLLIKENKHAFDAVCSNNVSKMEKIFKTDGIKQEAIDHLIFYVTSVNMMELFLRYGGDVHILGPPLNPTPITLLLENTASLINHAADSIKRRNSVKLIKFLIEEGADFNAVNEFGSTPFMNCAKGGDVKLCKFLVERGADPSVKRKDGGTALHGAAGSCHVDVFRYLVEDCGLDINDEYQDENMRPRTPLFLAAMNGNIDVCRYLLEMGAKFDAGSQSLMAAAQV